MFFLSIHKIWIQFTEIFLHTVPVSTTKLHLKYKIKKQPINCSSGQILYWRSKFQFVLSTLQKVRLLVTEKYYKKNLRTVYDPAFTVFIITIKLFQTSAVWRKKTIRHAWCTTSVFSWNWLNKMGYYRNSTSIRSRNIAIFLDLTRSYSEPSTIHCCYERAKHWAINWLEIWTKIACNIISYLFKDYSPLRVNEYTRLQDVLYKLFPYVST